MQWSIFTQYCYMFLFDNEGLKVTTLIRLSFLPALDAFGVLF